MEITTCDLIPRTSRSSSLVGPANHIVYAHIISRLSECDTATEAARNAAKLEATTRLSSPGIDRSSQDSHRHLSSTGGNSSNHRSGSFGTTSPFEPRQHSYSSLVENVYEFDDCSYRVILRRDGGMQISFLSPSLSRRFFDECCLEQIRALIQEHFPTDIAMLLPQEEHEQFPRGDKRSGPKVSMEVNVLRMSKLTHANRESRQHWATALASLRIWVIGNPLRQQFIRLRDCVDSVGPTQALCHRQGQVFFVTPYAESLAIVFPLRFSTPQDAAIGASFLQEFDAARTHAALRNSVSSTYRPSHAPPGEICDMDPKDLEGINGGYMVFQIFRRHVDGPHLDNVLWAMSTFYHLVNFNIKSSKSMIHERLRRKVEHLLYQERLSVLSQQPQLQSQLQEL